MKFFKLTVLINKISIISLTRDMSLKLETFDRLLKYLAKQENAQSKL